MLAAKQLDKVVPCVFFDIDENTILVAVNLVLVIFHLQSIWFLSSNHNFSCIFLHFLATTHIKFTNLQVR